MNLRQSLFFSIITALLFLSSCKTVPIPFPGADTYLEEIKVAGETPGMAVTVYKDGKKIYSKGFGIAHLEQNTFVFPDKTRFRIGSISKALTAAGLGVLMQENKIDVDLPITHYIPWYPEKKYIFNTRQLAGHLAGIRHYKDREFLSMKHFDTVKDGLEMFINDPLLHKPGTIFQYSSHGFNLLSAVMEAAADQAFLPFMREKVFDPLAMHQTVADLKDTIIPFRSGFYSMDKGRIVNGPYVDNSNKWAGGGFLSTSEDIARFGNAILYNRLIDESTKEELIQPQTLLDGSKTDYGMGWFSGKDSFGREYYGHGGGSVGGSCNLLIYPDSKLVIAALTNDSRSKTGNELFILANLFLKKY